MKVRVVLPEIYDGEYNGVYNNEIYEVIENPEIIAAVELMNKYPSDPDEYLLEVEEGYTLINKHWCTKVNRYVITIPEEIFE